MISWAPRGPCWVRRLTREYDEVRARRPRRNLTVQQAEEALAPMLRDLVVYPYPAVRPPYD